MPVPAKSKVLQDHFVGENNLSHYVPKEFAKIVDPQTAIPGIAKDSASIQLIETAVRAFRFLGRREIYHLTSVARKEFVLARVSFRLTLFASVAGHH